MVCRGFGDDAQGGLQTKGVDDVEEKLLDAENEVGLIGVAVHAGFGGRGSSRKDQRYRHVRRTAAILAGGIARVVRGGDAGRRSRAVNVDLVM